MPASREHLNLEAGSLKIGGVPAKVLAGKYGTPVYVTDLDRAVEKYDSASAAIVSRHSNSLIAFAYKSNSTRALVEALTRRGAGATVVSGAGLRLARACGVPPKNVVLDGPSKSRDELAAAIRAGVGMINAESSQEVLDIESLCLKFGVGRCRVGLRVNFGIRADTHKGLATGSSGHKFGVPRGDVVRFCRGEARRLKGVRLVGLHSHIGSQIADMDVFRRQTEELVGLAKEMQDLTGVPLEEFNFGGGLGFPYEGEGEVGFDEYACATAGTFARLTRARGSRAPRLVFELGRSLVADSTVLLTRVNYLKRVGSTDWALVDAGMNDFMRPALYGAYHEIIAAETSLKARSNASHSIGGPVCESTDVLGTRRKLGVELSPGDVLAILDVGAYGISMASHYNMRPIPAVVVVSKGRHRVAQKSQPA